MKEKTKVRSWELIDDKTLFKKTDKSFFKYAGATIPGPMHDFFDAEPMRNGERWEIRIRYEGSLYDAHLEKESLYLGRVRIFWCKELKAVFLDVIKENSEFPLLTIVKIADNVYEFRLR